MTNLEAKATELLDAWTTQDVDSVANLYAADVVYVDPNTRGPVQGRDAMKRYLRKLFANWDMTWKLLELQPGEQPDACAVKWEATFQLKGRPERTVRTTGLDLVELRDGEISRNEVYFDRSVLAEFGVALSGA